MSKDKPNKAESSADGPRVKFVVRPDNVALISPPAEHLAPLLEYQKFFIEGQPGDVALDDAELSPCSAFPAGLLSRFEAALTAEGYQASIDDRRPRAGGFAVNKRLCRDSQDEVRAFLRAVVKEPLG